MNAAAGRGAWLQEQTTLKEGSVGPSTMEVMGTADCSELDV